MEFDEAVAQTERLVLDAVERRLFADVPVATLLSGGVDSSLVCWAVAKLGADVTAYTAGTPRHPLDETDDAVATAHALNVRHDVLRLSDDDDVGISELVRAFAEPFACSSALGMLRLSRAISSTTARVVLTGDGGDDVFLGYPRHRMLWRTQRVARYLPAWAASSWQTIRRAVPRRGVLRRLVHAVDYTTGGLAAFVRANPGLEDFRWRGLLGPRLADADFPGPDAEWTIAAARHALSEYLAYDRDTQFVSEYLVKVDGATMHYSLEARSPFLDHLLWEHAAALPFDVRLHGGQLKAILREIARRRIGARVAAGHKRGFSIPVEAWMGGRWHDRVATSLRDSHLANDGWIARGPLQAEVADAAHRGVASRRLWYLWVLEEWLREEASAAAMPTSLPAPHLAAAATGPR